MKFTALINTSSGGQKVAGLSEIDFSYYINKKMNNIEENKLLQKCPDKKAKIWFKIETLYLGDIKNPENFT